MKKSFLMVVVGGSWLSIVSLLGVCNSWGSCVRFHDSGLGVSDWLGNLGDDLWLSICVLGWLSVVSDWSG